MDHSISSCTADARPDALWERCNSRTSVPNNYVVATSPSAEIPHSTIKDQSVPVLKRSLENNTSLNRKRYNKVCECQIIDIIKKRRETLKDTIAEVENNKQPVEIVLRGLAKTVMRLPPALASEVKIKVKNTVMDLKYRSLYYTNAPEHNIVSARLGHPITEYYSPSSATASSKFSQSDSSNSQFSNE